MMYRSLPKNIRNDWSHLAYVGFPRRLSAFAFLVMCFVLYLVSRSP